MATQPPNNIAEEGPMPIEPSQYGCNQAISMLRLTG
jgi:hypothetical protein